MYNHSDPTAAQALGTINREFSRLEKKATRICRLFLEGKITQEEWKKAEKQFTGIYRHVLRYTLEKEEASYLKNTPR